MAAIVHPTAQVSPEARLAEGVQVGAFAIIDGHATIGRDTILRPFAQIVGTVTLGEGNDVGSGCILGDRPQHRGYKGEPTGVVIGHGNIFREHCTVHRGMPDGRAITRIGNDNYFMANSHVAHDCIVGDHCNFANGAAIGGHVVIEDRVFISGNSVVHQHVRVGRLALISGVSATSQDIPPFWMIQDYNAPVGINAIGMRRAGIPTAEIKAVQTAFRLIYESGLGMSTAVDQLARQFTHSRAVQDVVEFIRASKRGVAGAHRLQTNDSDAAAA